MNASRTTRFLTGLALLGSGGVLIASAARATRGGEPAAADNGGTRVEKVFTIARPPDDLYAFWRDFTRLPEVMPHLRSVEVDGMRSHWVAKAPAHLPVSWDAEIVADRPGELIAWRSIGGAVRSAGSVRFTPAPGDRGTEVRVEMEYALPGGRAAAAIAKIFPEDPAHELENDLRRFKSLMEAGDVALNGTDVTA